jgi:hypothetical protein
VILAAHHDDAGPLPAQSWHSTPLAAAVLPAAARALAAEPESNRWLVVASCTGAARAGAGARRFLAEPPVSLDRVGIVVTLDAIVGVVPVVASRALPPAVAAALARVAPAGAVAEPTAATAVAFAAFGQIGRPTVYLGAAALPNRPGSLDRVAEIARAAVAVVSAVGTE